MHGVECNFDKMLPYVKETLTSQINEDDCLQPYSDPTVFVDDHHLIGLSLQELINNKELWFVSKLEKRIHR